jgi:hypothetical protein
MNRRRLWIESLEDRMLPSVDVFGLPQWGFAGPRGIVGEVNAPPDDAAAGNIQSVAIDPHNSSIMWLGTANGGAWRTTNAVPILDPTNPPAPVHWQAMTDRLPSLAVGTVAIDPLDSSGNTVWAGTGNFTAGAFGAKLAAGVWRTSNGGATWVALGQNIANPANGGFRVRKVLPTGVVLGPAQQELVLVSTIDGGGLFRSTDGGANFHGPGDPLGPTFLGPNGFPDPAFLKGYSLTDLMQDPNKPGTFYAAIPGHGVYISLDGAGAMWHPINNGLPFISDAGADSTIQLAAQTSGGSTVLYALIDGPQPLGKEFKQINAVYTLANGGTGWTQLAPPPPGALHIVADPDPKHSGVVYISAHGNDWIYDPTGAGTWYSIDGVDAKNNTAPHVDNHVLTFLINSPGGHNTLVDTSDGGIYYLIDPNNPMGYGWQSFVGDLGDVEFYHTALNTDTNLILGAAQDNGIAAQFPDGQWVSDDQGDGVAVAYDHLGMVEYEVSTYFTSLTHNHSPASLLGANSIDLDPKNYGLFPIATNPFAKNQLLLGKYDVYESTDNGDHLMDITSQLPGFDNNTWSLLYGGSHNGPQSNVAYVGTYGGELYFRGESGSAFSLLSSGVAGVQPVVAKPLPGYGAIWSIAADPQDWRHVYVVDGDSIYTCSNVTDPNAQFNDITGNLSSLTNNFRSITLVPTASGLVPVVGAFGGVYRLLNGTWSLYGGNLPNVLVDDLRYYPAIGTGSDRLLACTYGRGVWQMFNVSANITTPSVLQINVSPDFAGQTNFVDLRLDPYIPNLLDVTANSSVPMATFPIDSIQQINVNGLSGYNTIICDFSNGAFLPGGINVTGTSGSNHLQVIDGPSDDTIQITSTGVSITPIGGSSPAASIAYTGVAGLELDTGAGNNKVNVESLGTALTIGPGPGSNWISLAKTSGNLDSLGGSVMISRGFASSIPSIRLDLYDSNNSNNETWLIGSTYVDRGNFTLSYVENAALTIFAGGGNNSLTVYGNTALGTALNENLLGNDMVTVAYSGLAGDVSVNGGKGTGMDTLTVVDTFDNANVAWLTQGNLVQAGSGNVVRYRSLTGVSLDAGNGNNTFAVMSTGPTTPFTLNTGAGKDTITVSLSLPGGASAIGAPLTVIGQGGTDALVLDDRLSTTPITYNFTPGQILRILTTISYRDIASLTLYDGSGGNQIYVDSSAIPVTVNAGAGNDVVTLGGIEFGESLGGILAPVAVNGQGASTTLVLNDQTNASSTEYDIFAGSVMRFQGSQLPTITYNHIGALTLNAGKANNTFLVESTAASTQLTVNTGAGNDSISLGQFASLASIFGQVSVNGQGGTDQLFLRDQLDKTGTTYYLYSGLIDRVTSSAYPNIYYSHIAQLTLFASNASNTIDIEQTAATTAVTVNANANNTIILGGGFLELMAGIVSAVTVNGAGSSDQLILDDRANHATADQVTAQVTATGNQVETTPGGSFFGPGGVLAYNYIGTVSIYTSNTSTGSKITVTPVTNMVFDVFGAGTGNSLTVNPLNGTPLMQHSTATGAGNYTLPSSSTILVNYSDMQSVTPVGLLAVGVGAGHAPDVKVYDAQSGVLKYELHPFDKRFNGGVRVAVGHVNGDGIPDVVTAEGNGGGTVQVFDGATGKPLSGPLGSFTPFGPHYNHGLWVAAADVNGDGYADIVVGEDAGGEPRVRVFSGKDGSLLYDFLAFDKSFRGGVRVAVADFNHDHHADIVAGQGPGGQAVNVFEGANLSANDHTPAPAFSILQPFGADYHDGVFVATGDVHGDGTPKILVSQGAGRDPEVAVFDGAAEGKELARFVVRAFQNGARVTAADINGDGRADIVVGAVQGDSVVRGYDGLSLQEDGHFTAFGPSYQGGIFVGGFGRWGDFATAVGRTLSGPQGELQSALANLTTIQAGLTNGHDSRKLAEALDLLNIAFNSPAWLDSSHLLGDRGADIFTNEEAALQLIADLIQSSAAPVQKLEDDLSRIVLSDEELAEVAITEAKVADTQKVKHAQAALQEGQNDFAAVFAGGAFKPNQLGNALDDFRDAWELASNA